MGSETVAHPCGAGLTGLLNSYKPSCDGGCSYRDRQGAEGKWSGSTCRGPCLHVGFLQLGSIASENSSSWDVSTLRVFYDTMLQSHESPLRLPQQLSLGVSFGSWVAREQADVTCVTC